MGTERQRRQKILVVDDSEINRSILADMLGGEFEMIEAENGRQAVDTLECLNLDLDLVLLDIVMPVMDGFRVLEIMNDKRWIEEIPVIMISAENMPAYVERAYDLGVSDYIQRPFDARIIRRRVLNTIMLHAKQKRLMGIVADQIYEKEKASNLMVEILSHIVEFRNGESGQHVIHIRSLTELLLSRLTQKTDRYGLSRGDISVIGQASALHDIGKIAIPESILNKPGPLTKEEFEIMKTHAAKGGSMLEHLALRQNEPLVREAYVICRWHHERYDGRGYPDGLEGEGIPISAQVVALADVYDALTSARVYKEAYPHKQAMEMILHGECGVFNPLLLECLTEVSTQIEVEMHMDSRERQLQMEIRGVAQEVSQNRELTASDRTLRLLEHERTKYRFFASMSKEIQFEYTVVPDVLTVSEWGAHYLGISEIQVKPANSLALYELMGKRALRELVAKLRGTTPEQPVIEYSCAINIRGERRWGKIISRAMWSGDEPPEYLGAIGKFVDIHEEHSRIEALEQLASHDGLTGLLNRDSARKRIELLLSENQNKDYALAVVDLDHFKEANDQRGHLFGDQVLKHMADMLRRSIRSSDLAARVGGDEFLLFMECSDQAQAQAQRVFRALSGNFEGFPISVSMGVARAQKTARSYEVLFRRADQALYAAKRAGRERCFFYDDSMREMLSVLSPIESDEDSVREEPEK